jgi:hypothetical protein
MNTNQPDGEKLMLLAYIAENCLYIEPHEDATPEDEAKLKHIEALLRRQVLTAQIREVENAITEYNHLQEYMTEPSQDLKFGNSYLLDRLAALRDELAGLEGEK